MTSPREPEEPDQPREPARRPRRKLGLILFAFLLLALLAVAVDRLSPASMARRARTLRVGDSKQQVERLLGRPVQIYMPLPDTRTNFLAMMLSVDAETWAYGSRLNLTKPFHAQFPYFSPGDLIRFRMLKPEADDIAIEFDSSGKIEHITIPP